jgi:hypothetical protein
MANLLITTFKRWLASAALFALALRVVGADGYTLFVMGTNEVAGPVITRDRFIGDASGLTNGSPNLATNAPGASNNWVLSLSGDKLAWQPIHTTNFSGAILQVTNQLLLGSTNWATPLITLTQNWVGIGGPAFPLGANVQISAQNLAVSFYDSTRGRFYVIPTSSSGSDYNANQARWMLRSESAYNTVLGLYCPKDNGVVYLTGGSGDTTRPIISIGDAPPVISGGPGSVYLSGDTIRIRQSRIILSNSAAAYPGEVSWDTNRLWVANGTNSWRHILLSDFSTNFVATVAKTNTGSSTWSQTISFTAAGGPALVGLVFETVASQNTGANTFNAQTATAAGSAATAQLFNAGQSVFSPPTYAFVPQPSGTITITLNGTISTSGDFVYGNLYVYVRRP